MAQLQTFLEKVDAFLVDFPLSETRFGELACNDPNFLFEVRKGRDLRLSTVERVERFMTGWRESGGHVE